MRKSFKLMVALIVAIIALPVLGSSVFAEEGDGQVEGDTQEIDYIMLKSDENKVSSADGFFEKPAIVKKENGINYVEMKVTSSNMIKKITVPSGIVETVSEDKENDTRVIGFELESDLSEVMLIGLEIDTHSEYGTMKHTVRTYFDVPNAEIPELEDPKNEEEQPKEDAEINDGIIKEEGYYTINVDYLRIENDDSSAMANYMADSAFISVKDGKVELTLAVADKNVTKLQINGNDPSDEKVEGDTRYVTFELDNLPSVLDDVYVKYQAPYNGSVFESSADFRISFDEESIDGKADEQDKYAADYVPAKVPTPGEKEQSGDEKVTKDKKEKVDPLAVDKAYEYDYVVKHETEDKASAADKFFKKPATVLYKDGEKYIQLTVTNWEWIKSLKTANGEVVVVQKNKDGSAVVQFKVDGELSDAITLSMHVVVPKEVAGMEYDMNHEARLFLDMDSEEEVDAGDYELTILDNDNATTNPETEEVPNPQTGDTSNIWLYALLLIGSIVPLAIKMKRRFV